ncbi:hypothetical protein BJ964_000577 [Actinoplanes lobatus]|uniref:Uncharacterized protein n=1 Tax=Actinoplanes lobatus TaxID=113568 RepID=A0A7W7MDP3_9ACTN|nr:hypothetical protein [Actinoplanes lobatus]
MRQGDAPKSAPTHRVSVAAVNVGGARRSQILAGEDRGRRATRRRRLPAPLTSRSIQRARQRRTAMASTAKTFKRCGCRNQQGNRLEQNCPRLPERGHGLLVLPVLRAEPARPFRTHPPQRLPVPGRCPASPRRHPRRQRRPAHWRRLDPRTLAPPRLDTRTRIPAADGKQLLCLSQRPDRFLWTTPWCSLGAASVYSVAPLRYWDSRTDLEGGGDSRAPDES